MYLRVISVAIVLKAMKREEIKKRVEIDKRQCRRTDSCDLPTLTDLEIKQKRD